MFLTPSFPGFLSLILGRLFWLERWEKAMSNFKHCVHFVLHCTSVPRGGLSLWGRQFHIAFSCHLKLKRIICNFKEAPYRPHLCAILRNAVQIPKSIHISGLSLHVISFLKLNANLMRLILSAGGELISNHLLLREGLEISAVVLHLWLNYTGRENKNR